MRPKHIVAASVALVLTLAAVSTANAGRITDFDCTFIADPPAEHWWDFNYEVQKLDLRETMHGIGNDLVGMSGDISLGGPRGPTVFHVTKQVENTTGAAWIGYGLELRVDPGAEPPEFVPGTAFSDRMTLYAELPSLLEFIEPQWVLHGERVTFDFDIAIPESSPFDFTLRQLAYVPEAATMLLLGLGGLLFVRRHQSRSRVLL